MDFYAQVNNGLAEVNEILKTDPNDAAALDRKKMYELQLKDLQEADDCEDPFLSMLDMLGEHAVVQDALKRAKWLIVNKMRCYQGTKYYEFDVSLESQYKIFITKFAPSERKESGQTSGLWNSNGGPPGIQLFGGRPSAPPPPQIIWNHDLWYVVIRMLKLWLEEEGFTTERSRSGRGPPSSWNKHLTVRVQHDPPADTLGSDFKKSRGSKSAEDVEPQLIRLKLNEKLLEDIFMAKNEGTLDRKECKLDMRDHPMENMHRATLAGRVTFNPSPETVGEILVKRDGEYMKRLRLCTDRLF